MTPEEQQQAAALGVTKDGAEIFGKYLSERDEQEVSEDFEGPPLLNTLPVQMNDAGTIETESPAPQTVTNDTSRQFIHREAEIIEWGKARGICGDNALATKRDQHRKTMEEVRELGHAIVTANRDEARDAIGDIIVTLVMQAQMWGFTLAECIEAAWQQIKDRRGKMVDGVFVKEVVV